MMNNKWRISLAILSALSMVATTSRPQRTLAFVFDITFSMVADLEHLKFAIGAIFNDVTANLEERYSHYMFLGFHDPSTFDLEFFPILFTQFTQFFVRRIEEKSSS